MSLIRRAFGPEQRRADALVSRIVSGGRSTAGAFVSPDTAMRLSVVWRCQSLIADLVAGLPYDVVRQVGPDRVPVDPVPPFIASPSRVVRPISWRYQFVRSALARGNAYALVTERGRDTWPLSAEVLDPSVVTVVQPSSFDPPTYKVKGQAVEPGAIIHMTAWEVPGSAVGLSPLEYAAATVGMGLAAQDYAAGWYADGGHPTTILTVPGKITKDEAAVAKERWREATTNDHLAVIGGNAKVDSVQVSPAEAAFIESGQWSAVQLCQFYGVPPEFLGLSMSGSSISYANREQRMLDLLTFTLQWWIGRLEECLSWQLPNRQVVKGNVSALLRTDAAQRWGIHKIAREIGARNVDEIRRLEDELPLPDGQGQSYLPLRSTPAPTNGGPTP